MGFATKAQTPPTPEVGKACRLHRTHHGGSEVTRTRCEAKRKSESAPEERVIGTDFKSTLVAKCARRASSACLHLILTKIQVGKDKPVARYDFPHFYRQVVSVHRACVDERVEFPVLSAGINLCR
jgi:hypothetical protein